MKDPGAAGAGKFWEFDSIIKAAPQAPLSIFGLECTGKSEKNLPGMICNCAGTKTPQIFALTCMNQVLRSMMQLSPLLVILHVVFILSPNRQSFVWSKANGSTLVCSSDSLECSELNQGLYQYTIAQPR